MVVYKKDGKDYILMANSVRGVMKISTENIGTKESISTKVNDTAGLPYEKVKSLEGVLEVSVDCFERFVGRGFDSHSQGSYSLKSIALP